MPESENESSSKGIYNIPIVKNDLKSSFFPVHIENSVKELQASLFPPSPRGSGSFLSNFLLKFTPNTEDNEENRVPTVKETTSVRDLFSINRDQIFSFQSPRWPTECQVLYLLHSL